MTGWEPRDSRLGMSRLIILSVNTLSRPRVLEEALTSSYLRPVSLTFPLPPSVITTMGDSGEFYAKIPTTPGPVSLSLPSLTDSGQRR